MAGFGEDLAESPRVVTSSVISAGGQQRALAVWAQIGFFFFFVALDFNFCNFIGATDCMCIARGLWQAVFGIGVHSAWAEFLICWWAAACCA